jgi:phosphate transport system substrate-binding protein
MKRSTSFRLTARSSLAVIALALLGACHAPETQDTLLIAGSTSLGAYLEPVVEAFKLVHPGGSIVSEPGGSTAGLIALKRGAIDMATIAREVAADEDDVSLRDYLIARDGVAIVVNPRNPVGDLTMHQLTQLLTAEVTDWKALGGEGPIVLIDRKHESGDPTKPSRTRKSLLDLVFSGDDSLRGTREVAGYKDVAEAIRADVHAVGFLSLKDMPGDLKSVAIEGVPMTRATMLSGRYHLTRSFYLAVYRKPGKLADAFVEFTLSQDGQAILEKQGLLAVH